MRRAPRLQTSLLVKGDPRQVRKSASKTKRSTRSKQATYKKPKQLPLFDEPGPRFFGGRLLHGRRRKQRPLATREAIHLVFRSSYAKGATSFLKSYNKKPIEQIIEKTAAKYGVKIYRKSLAGNHVHLVLRITNRKLYNTFIRVMTSKIASHIMKGKSFAEFKAGLLAQRSQKMQAEAKHETFPKSLPKSLPTSLSELTQVATQAATHEVQGKGQRFFQFRPFSRVLSWGRDYLTCCNYVVQNTLEALGFIAYQPRGRCRYANWIRETMPSVGFS